MLKEREVLMVPPSREGCCIDRNGHLCGRVDSVKNAAFNSHLQQGRPARDGFDLGVPGDAGTGGGECPAEDKGEEEAGGKNCSDDRLLAPSSPSIAAVVAAASSSPTMHEEGHSGMVHNSEGDFGSSRAPARNGWSTTENGLVAKENGFVSVSEKRMRNGERPASYPPAVGAGNEGGESFQEDSQGVPMRKRMHVSDDSTVDGLSKRGGEVGMSSGRVDSSEGNKSVSPGVVTPTKSDEGKPSEGKMSPDSGEKGGLNSARTEEVNGEGVFETEEAIPSQSGEDVEMVAAEEVRAFVWEGDDHGSSASGSEKIPVYETQIFVDLKTSEEEFGDMDVDPVSVENIEPVGMEEVGGLASPRAVERDGIHLQEQPVLEQDAEDHPKNRFGSPELRPPSLPDTREGSFQEEERSHQRNTRRTRPRQQVPRDVEVIEFDDSDDDDNQAFGEARVVYESDGSSTKGKKPISSQVGGQNPQRRNGYRYSSSESTAPSHNRDAEDSDSDDCQVLGSRQPPNANGHGSRDGAANPVVFEDDDDDDDNYTTTEDQDSDSSIVEEVGDSQSDIRRRWEEAAMRRRMGRAMQSAGSKANASQGGTVDLDDNGTESQGNAESVATSTYRGSADSKDQTETSEARGGLNGIAHRTEGPQSTTFRADEGQQPVRASHVEDVILNNFDESVAVEVPETLADCVRPRLINSAGSDEGNISGSKCVRVETPGVTKLDRVKPWSTVVQSENQKGEPSSRDSDENGDERSPSKDAVLDGLENRTRENQDVDGEAVEAEKSVRHEDLLAGKERLKQTDHYRRTDAEEWASRQQEIVRQAAESKRLKQRKRQEADRKREMERKQKERIEELRLTQRKEERQMDLKDQLRGQVRTELERIAGNCMDFATLLRKLGIPVEGGSNPSTQQVNAAYKKALFKFHPDRAVASSQGEPKKQVEAEEKFKLIQRLKDTLIPVANGYTYPTYKSFF